MPNTSSRRRAVEWPGLSRKLQLSQLPTDAESFPALSDRARLSHSLVRGLLTYAAFPHDGSYLGVMDLARHLDLTPSTTYRYVSTLLVAGLLERDPNTRRYRRTKF